MTTLSIHERVRLAITQESALISPQTTALIELSREMAYRFEKLVEVAKAYEAWEADLIENADWSQTVFTVTEDQYDRMMEIQAMRNDALSPVK